MDKLKSLGDKIDIKAVVIGGVSISVILFIYLTNEWRGGRAFNTITVGIIVLSLVLLGSGLVGIMSRKKPWLDGALACILFFLIIEATIKNIYGYTGGIRTDDILRLIYFSLTGAFGGFVGGKISTKIRAKKEYLFSIFKGRVEINKKRKKYLVILAVLVFLISYLRPDPCVIPDDEIYDSSFYLYEAYWENMHTEDFLSGRCGDGSLFYVEEYVSESKFDPDFGPMKHYYYIDYRYYDAESLKLVWMKRKYWAPFSNIPSYASSEKCDAELRIIHYWPDRSEPKCFHYKTISFPIINQEMDPQGLARGT